ncbi:MAG: YkgJ family cysteine cluster protein [Burkholderiaceae bacterium]
MTQPDNACLTCGVCCMSYRVAFHWSETTDHPYGRVPVELTEPLRRHEVVMRGTAHAPIRCIALTGMPGQRVSCAIHGTHPECCREVALGDDQCTRARQMHGLPALQPLLIARAYAADDPPALPLASLPGSVLVAAPAGETAKLDAPAVTLSTLDTQHTEHTPQQIFLSPPLERSGTESSQSPDSLGPPKFHSNHMVSMPSGAGQGGPHENDNPAMTDPDRASYPDGGDDCGDAERMRRQ